MDDRATRIGKNEALFREVNERIRELTSDERDAEFLCECGDPSCTKPIPLTPIRLKCALLGLGVLKVALNRAKGTPLPDEWAGLDELELK